MFACLRYLLERLPCTFTMHIRYTASNWVNDVGHWLVRILLTQQRIDSKLFKLLSVNILELMPLRNVHPSSICMIPLIGQVWNTGPLDWFISPEFAWCVVNTIGLPAWPSSLHSHCTVGKLWGWSVLRVPDSYFSNQLNDRDHVIKQPFVCPRILCP